MCKKGKGVKGCMVDHITRSGHVWPKDQVLFLFEKRKTLKGAELMKAFRKEFGVEHSPDTLTRVAFSLNTKDVAPMLVGSTLNDRVSATAS